MKKALVVTAVFVLGQLISGHGSFPSSAQAAPAGEGRGGGPAGGGRGFAPRGEFHGGGRGFAPGGEMGERGERGGRGERGEFREHEEHERHEGREHFEGGFFIGPEYGYYPYYYEEGPEYYGPPPGYLYYCEDPPGYYPNVPQCPEGWEEVPVDQEY